MRRLVALGSLAATLMVSGCGGSGSSDREQIESTVRDYYTAFADRDGDKACDQLTGQARAQFTRVTHAKNCAAALAAATERPDVKPFTTKLRDARVISVSVHGDNATARVRAIGATTAVPLHREGGGWKVQGGPVGTGG